MFSVHINRFQTVSLSTLTRCLSPRTLARPSLRQSHMAVVTSAFPKSSVFAVHRRFQIYPLWRAFSKSSVFGHRKRRFSVDGRPIRIKKSCVFKFIRLSVDVVLLRRNLKTEVSLCKRIKCFPSTLRWRNLKTEVSLWKRIKCFPSTLRWRNLKTEVSLCKHIKCFPSTLRRRNLKTEVSLWKRIKCFPSTLRWRNLKTEVSLWKRIKCFPSTLRQRNSKAILSAVILNLCLRKTRSVKSRDYCDVIVFKKLRFQIVFRPRENAKSTFLNSSGLKSVFVKRRFRGGLV